MTGEAGYPRIGSLQMVPREFKDFASARRAITQFPSPRWRNRQPHQLGDRRRPAKRILEVDCVGDLNEVEGPFYFFPASKTRISDNRKHINQSSLNRKGVWEGGCPDNE